MTFFTYGSLEFAAVMRAVTGRSFAHERGRLDGWARFRVRAGAYPGIRPHAEMSVPGTLWRGVDAASAARLDRFETAIYERRTLRVRSASGESLDAQVYVIPPRHYGELTHEPWDLARFARVELAGFLRALNR
jgi:gamma-glutamylcyclotransferase (GGCT)/AIG2-like uncharacterized protein YtfP